MNEKEATSIIKLLLTIGIIFIGIVFISLIIQQLIIVLWNISGPWGIIIFGMPILLAVIATYEFYRQNNKKLDWGEILPYFSGALLLMVVFELLLVSLFFNCRVPQLMSVLLTEFMSA
jgi:hypothetical protein